MTLFIKGKIKYPNQPCPMGKNNCSLNPPTGCIPVGGNAGNQVFVLRQRVFHVAVEELLGCASGHVLQQNLNSPQLKVTNWWHSPFRILCQRAEFNCDKSSRTWSSKTTPDHHTPTPMLLTASTLFFLWNAVSCTSDVTVWCDAHLVQFYILSVRRMFSPKNLVAQDVCFFHLFSWSEMGIWDFIGQQWFSCWNSLTELIFALR